MNKTNSKKEGASENKKIYANIVIKKLPKSQVEITGIVETADFEAFRSKALKNINNEITVDGFRKGNIPEKVLIAKVGEMPILEEMAELALASAYPSIVVDEKVDAIGRPQIQITKLATGNPLEFKIITAVIPEVKLADYKKVAKEVLDEASNKSGKKSVAGSATDSIEVTDKDVDEAINRIRRSYAEHNHKHDESHDKMTKEEHEKEIEAGMPALDEDFIAKLGRFKDLADFKTKIRATLIEDKKEQAKEKLRILLSDKISDATEVDIPDVLVQSEVRRIEAQFRDDVTRMGVTFDDYLKHAKKTLEEIHTEWRPHAEKKAKLQIVLNKIAEAEKLEVDEKEIETEVKHILDHYKDADKENAYIYAQTVLTNEKVFKFLEEQK